VYAQTTIVGRLGADPKEAFLPDGTAVTTFSVATDRSWTKDGEKQKRTTWYRVSAFRRLAETVAQYLSKGKLVLVVGSLTEPKPYQGKDGEWRASLSLTADTVKFLSPRSDAATAQPAEGYAEKPEVVAAKRAAEGDDLGEDLPF